MPSRISCLRACYCLRWIVLSFPLGLWWGSVSAEGLSSIADLQDKTVKEQLDLLYVLAKGQENHDFRQAFDAASRGYRLATTHNLEKEKAAFAVSLGLRYADLGNFVEAKKYSLEALEYAVNRRDLTARIWALYPLSWIEAELGEMDLALQLAEESLRLSVQINNDTMQLWSYNMVGEVHRLWRHTSLATESYLTAKKIGEQIPYFYGLSTVQHNLGLIALQEGDYAQAEAYLAESSGKPSSNVSNYFEGALARCEIYLATQREQAALDTAAATMVLAVAQGARSWELAALKFLSEAHLKLEHYQMAWEYKRQEDSLRNVLKGENVRVQLAGMDLKFENEQIRDANALLERLNATQRWMVIFACTIMVLLAVVGVLLFKSNRRKKAMLTALGERNRLLDDVINEKDMLMNVMAHDLKSPLGAISGLMTLVEDPKMSVEDRAQFMVLMRRSLDRGNNLVTNLLELARLESGQVSLRSQELDLASMIGELFIDFKTIAFHKGILLETNIPGQSAVVMTDRILLRGILENLIGNAVKFTLPGKRIGIVLQPIGPSWAISIKDEGPGIGAEDQKRLFRKFQRLTAKPTGGESSSGLGLAIVKSMADKIGAHITVDSELGKGTIFTVTLAT